MRSSTPKIFLLVWLIGTGCFLPSVQAAEQASRDSSTSKSGVFSDAIGDTPTDSYTSSDDSAETTFAARMNKSSIPAIPDFQIPTNKLGPLAEDAEIAERPIQPRDKVIYRVIQDRDPPVTIPVLETGQIIIPYYGPVQAAGLTPSELASKIEYLLTQELYQKASVVIAVQKPAPSSVMGTVFLSGRVNRIGPMQIDATQSFTLAKVILTAGGFADFADSSAVQVVRQVPDTDQTEVIEVDVKSIIEDGELDKDIEVKDGDFIIVPQKLFNW